MINSQKSNQTIAVIGMGRVGLPLSLVLAKEGFEVIGVDIDEDRLQKVAAGQMPFLEEGAEDILKTVYGKGLIAVHENALAYFLPKIDTIILTLGTTIDDSLNPNLSQITNFFEKFKKSIQKGQTFILRSTVSIGTTEYIARFIKEELGFTVGKEIFLACCPERIAEGHAIKELYELPQIIGADDPQSQQKAAAIFQKVASEIMFADSKSAELAKLFSNTYRYIDFAIGNEFMLIAENHNRDIYEILHLVNHNYKRRGLKSPGLTAGACLVKDSFFLIDRNNYLDLVTAAWRINENIPGFLIDKIKKEVQDLNGKNVALLGLGFKRDIDDTRNSLSLKIEQYLKKEGAKVLSHDPFIPSHPLEEALQEAEIVIISMNHSSFKEFTLEYIANFVSKKCVICDIWNILGVGKIVFPLANYLPKTNQNKKLVVNGMAKKTTRKISVSRKGLQL